jgi:hypothetical protein
MIRPTILRLLNELEEADAIERARWTRIAAAALLASLPPTDRIDALGFINWRARQDLS